MLKELLSDIIKIDDILIIVRSEGAIIEMKSNSLNIRQKDKWITIGDNDDPCHTILIQALFLKLDLSKNKKQTEQAIV